MRSVYILVKIESNVLLFNLSVTNLMLVRTLSKGAIMGAVPFMNSK